MSLDELNDGADGSVESQLGLQHQLSFLTGDERVDAAVQIRFVVNVMSEHGAHGVQCRSISDCRVIGRYDVENFVADIAALLAQVVRVHVPAVDKRRNTGISSIVWIRRKNVTINERDLFNTLLLVDIWLRPAKRRRYIPTEEVNKNMKQGSIDKELVFSLSSDSIGHPPIPVIQEGENWSQSLQPMRGSKQNSKPFFPS